MTEKNAAQSFCVALVEIEKPGEIITGEGLISDVAYSLGFWSASELFENGIDYQAECARQSFKDFDWETWTRDKLNANPAPSWDSTKSDYLFGDELEINTPKTFAFTVEGEKEEAARELFDVCPFNEEARTVPPELMRELIKGRDWNEESMRHEWLYGDRSSVGVLGELSKKLTGYHGNVGTRDKNGETDKIFIYFTEDQAREFIGYEIEETEPVTLEQLTEQVMAYLRNKAYVRREKDKARRQEQATRYAEQREREEKKRTNMIEEAKRRKSEAVK